MKHLKLFKESIDIPDELIDNFQEIEDRGLELLWKKRGYSGEYIYILYINGITLDVFEQVLKLETRLQSFEIVMLNYRTQKGYYDIEKSLIKKDDPRGYANANTRESIREIREIFKRENIVTRHIKNSKNDPRVWTNTRIVGIDFIIKSL